MELPGDVFPHASSCLEKNPSLPLTLHMLELTPVSASTAYPSIQGGQGQVYLAGQEVGPGTGPSLAVGQGRGGAGKTVLVDIRRGLGSKSKLPLSRSETG